VEAIRDFILQPPGCRQGTSLAPVAWHNCPAAKGGPSGLRILDRRRDPVVAAEHLRGSAATSAHAFTRSRRARFGHGTHAKVTACTLRSRRARFGHGAHASVTACTSRSLCARRGTAGTVDTEGPATSAAQLTRLGARLQNTAFTAPIMTFAALITAIPVTWSGQRARGPRRRRQRRQRLSESPERAGQNRQAAEFLALAHDDVLGGFFLLKRIASSANRRSGIRPGPGDGPGTIRRSTGCQAKRCVLILQAVLAAGRRASDLKHSGLWRPGALPACPPRSHLLGCGPWAPVAGSRPATRHRLGSPVPR
jgi:hypothetical protein